MAPIAEPASNPPRDTIRRPAEEDAAGIDEIEIVMSPEEAHDHARDQSHHHCNDHSHRLSVDADRRYLTIALVLIVGFMAFEIVIGIVAHSLALLSDAAHMLTDAGAICNRCAMSFVAAADPLNSIS